MSDPNREDEAGRARPAHPGHMARLSREDVSRLSTEQVCALVEELQLHQTELESANADLRTAQLELEATRARYRGLYANAPICCVTLDPAWDILDASDRTIEQLGSTRGQLIGTPFVGHVSRESQDDLHHFRRALERGDAPLPPCDLSMQREGGEHFVAEVQGRRLFDEDGGALLLLSFADVTQRRHMEREILDLNAELERRVRERSATARQRGEQLAHSRHQLLDREMMIQAILDSAIDAIITIDERGVIRTWNRAAQLMFGHAAAEVLGRNVHVLMPSPYREEHDQHLARYRQTGIPSIIGQRRELTGLRKDGTVFPIELAVSEVKDGTRYFLGVLRDLTERAHLQEELTRSQKMEAVGRFASGLAHNFNNLLAGIGGCCTVALRHLPSDSPARPFILETVGAIESGSAITRDLLAMASDRSGELQTLDFDETVRKCETMLSSLLREDIDLRMESTGEPIWIRAIPGRVEQAIMNLVVNSRDAMPRGGTLHIKVSRAEPPGGVPDSPRFRSGEWACLEVTDTGCGMDRDTRSRAFEPFFTTKGPDRGTGLGLSTVYGIVQDLGGHIRLNTELGAGCTFLLYIPVSPAPDSPRAAETEAAVPQVGGACVLLLEDDQLVRMSARIFLETAGFTVFEAARPSDALVTAREPGRCLDVLVTDMLLPEMDGSELAAQLRLLQPHIQTVYMSAYPARWLIAQGRLAPGTEVVEKPFRAEVLAAAVRKSLERQQDVPPGRGEPL